jgi:hypothetical protein
MTGALADEAGWRSDRRSILSAEFGELPDGALRHPLNQADNGYQVK